MKKLVLVILVGLVASVCRAEDNAPQLKFPVSGFSIAPLEGKGEGTYQALIMFLPPSDGFAPSVNVMAQPHEGTIEDYVALSKQGFKTMGWTVLSIKTKGDTTVFEYSGEMGKRELRFYAKAHLRAGKIYLVTGTALDSQWDDVSQTLKTCVDSFKLDPEKKAKK